MFSLNCLNKKTGLSLEEAGPNLKEVHINNWSSLQTAAGQPDFFYRAHLLSISLLIKPPTHTVRLSVGKTRPVPAGAGISGYFSAAVFDTAAIRPRSSVYRPWRRSLDVDGVLSWCYCHSHNKQIFGGGFCNWNRLERTCRIAGAMTRFFSMSVTTTKDCWQ